MWKESALPPKNLVGRFSGSSMGCLQLGGCCGPDGKGLVALGSIYRQPSFLVQQSLAGAD